MRTLFEAPLDPRSRFVRLILEEKGLSHEVREEPSWDRSPGFFMLDSAGDSPVLQETSGISIPGATVIAEYLEEAHGEKSLLGENLENRVEVRRLMGWFLDKLSREVTEALREEKFIKRVVRNEAPDSGVLRAALANLSYHLEYVGWLAEHRRCLGGEALSLADLAAAAQLSVLDYLGGLDWAKVPEAKRWYARMKSRPSMRNILEERVEKLAPPPHYADPDF